MLNHLKHDFLLRKITPEHVPMLLFMFPRRFVKILFGRRDRDHRSSWELRNCKSMYISPLCEIWCVLKGEYLCVKQRFGTFWVLRHLKQVSWVKKKHIWFRSTFFVPVISQSQTLNLFQGEIIENYWKLLKISEISLFWGVSKVTIDANNINSVH